MVRKDSRQEMAHVLSHGGERKDINQEDCFIRCVKWMDENSHLELKMII